MQIREQYLLAAMFGISPFLINGLIGSVLANSPAAYWTFEILIWLVIPSSALIYAYRTCGLAASDLGLNMLIFSKNRPLVLVTLCVVAGPIFYLAYESCLAFARSVTPAGGFFQHQSAIPESDWGRLTVITWFALSAGIVEEIFYRGLLFKIAKFTSSPIAVFLLVSPITFSIVHWENGPANLLATWLLGVILAVAYCIVRNLWPFIVGHTYTDLVWFS